MSTKQQEEKSLPNLGTAAGRNRCLIACLQALMRLKEGSSLRDFRDDGLIEDGLIPSDVQAGWEDPFTFLKFLQDYALRLLGFQEINPDFNIPNWVQKFPDPAREAGLALLARVISYANSPHSKKNPKIQALSKACANYLEQFSQDRLSLHASAESPLASRLDSEKSLQKLRKMVFHYAVQKVESHAETIRQFILKKWRGNYRLGAIFEGDKTFKFLYQNPGSGFKEFSMDDKNIDSLVDIIKNKEIQLILPGAESNFQQQQYHRKSGQVITDVESPDTIIFVVKMGEQFPYYAELTWCAEGSYSLRWHRLVDYRDFCEVAEALFEQINQLPNITELVMPENPCGTVENRKRIQQFIKQGVRVKLAGLHYQEHVLSRAFSLTDDQSLPLINKGRELCETARTTQALSADKLKILNNQTGHFLLGSGSLSISNVNKLNRVDLMLCLLRREMLEISSEKQIIVTTFSSFQHTHWNASKSADYFMNIHNDIPPQFATVRQGLVELCDTTWDHHFLERCREPYYKNILFAAYAVSLALCSTHKKAQEFHDLVDTAQSSDDIEIFEQLFPSQAQKEAQAATQAIHDEPAHPFQPGKIQSITLTIIWGYLGAEDPVGISLFLYALKTLETREVKKTPTRSLSSVSTSSSPGAISPSSTAPYSALRFDTPQPHHHQAYQPDEMQNKKQQQRLLESSPISPRG